MTAAPDGGKDPKDVVHYKPRFINVESAAFYIIGNVLILASAFIMLLEKLKAPPAIFWKHMDNATTILLTVELGCRIGEKRKLFLTEEGRWWNANDTFSTVLSLGCMIYQAHAEAYAVSAGKDGDVSKEEKDSTTEELARLKLLRMLRLVRLFRLLLIFRGTSRAGQALLLLKNIAKALFIATIVLIIFTTILSTVILTAVVFTEKWIAKVGLPELPKIE